MCKELNKKQATILGLRACGFAEQEGRSKLYQVFWRAMSPSDFLVGGSGALRKIKSGAAGLRPSVSVTNSELHDAFEYTGRFFERNPELKEDQYIKLALAYKKNQLIGLDLYKTPLTELCE